MPALKRALIYSLSARGSTSLPPVLRGALPGLPRKVSLSPFHRSPSVNAQVFSQRRPALHRVLDWEDELFALLMLLVARAPSLRLAQRQTSTALWPPSLWRN